MMDGTQQNSTEWPPHNWTLFWKRSLIPSPPHEDTQRLFFLNAEEDGQPACTNIVPRDGHLRLLLLFDYYRQCWNEPSCVHRSAETDIPPVDETLPLEKSLGQ